MEVLQDCARPVLPVQQFFTWLRQQAACRHFNFARPVPRVKQFVTCLWRHAGTSWTKRMRWQTAWPSCGKGAWLPLVLHSPSRLAIATGVALSRAQLQPNWRGNKLMGKLKTICCLHGKFVGRY